MFLKKKKQQSYLLFWGINTDLISYVKNMTLGDYHIIKYARKNTL